MEHHDDDCSTNPADLAFRRRALQTNSGIYARRSAPALQPVLTDPGIRSRHDAIATWLGSEAAWCDADARRVNELATEIRRFGRSRAPEVVELCDWHADRLRELVAQHAALRRLQTRRRTATAWPAARDMHWRRRKRGRAGSLA